MSEENLSIMWHKIGRICSLNLVLRIIQNVGTRDINVVTDVPKAIASTQFIMTSADGVPVVMRVTSAGNVQTQYAGTLKEGYDYRGSVTYITAE